MHTRDLSDLSEYVPGRGAEEVARELGLDPEELTALSSNENPFGPSPAAVEAVREAAPTVSRYPKAAHADLTADLADRWGLGREQVWVSPGADGALDYLARATLDPGDRTLAPDPGFAYYRMSARYHHGGVETYPVKKERGFEQTPETVLSAYDGERVVYLTSPHNPTGAEFDPDDVAAVADRVADHTLVVVDEAYGEYTDTPSAAGLLEEYDNVAVTRTFSKAYGLAGLRIGYALVPSAWGDAYARVNTPFAANEPALRGAMAALDDEDHVERTVETARWARAYLREELAARTWDSGANFVLVDAGDGLSRAGADTEETEADGSAADVVEERCKRAGLLVRNCSSFGLPDCVRVSCGTEAETREAVETLNTAFAGVPAR